MFPFGIRTFNLLLKYNSYNLARQTRSLTAGKMKCILY
jgi:hypothetical protein